MSGSSCGCTFSVIGGAKVNFHLVAAILCECQHIYIDCVFQGVSSIVLDDLDMPESELPFDWYIPELCI